MGLGVLLESICLSVVLSMCLIVSVPYLMGMVVYYEVVCHAEKLVHYLQYQGHSKGLYNQSMTFYYIFYTAGPFATRLGLIVQHHKLECPVGKWDYCVQAQGHSKSSKCQ